MPTFTVVAGPNGSGKSTITRLGRVGFQESPVLDPDAIAKSTLDTTTSEGSLLDAGREVLLSAEQLLRSKQSFLVETTLSGHTYLHMMKEAKSLGYTVILFFVTTGDVEINLQRVRDRVLSGGHDIPEADQRRRYPRSMSNMRKAFELADEASFFDNSQPQQPILLAVKDECGITIYRPLPAWAEFLKQSNKA